MIMAVKGPRKRNGRKRVRRVRRRWFEPTFEQWGM